MTALVRLLGRRRRLLVVSTVVLVAGGLASGLLAYFSGAASAGSAGGAAATSVAPGTPPTSVSSQPGRAVTISWEATTLANGRPVDGYLVTRYDANPPYAPQITLAGCGGIVAALGCTETAVPFGSWQYTITPVIGTNWRGTESTKSGTVTIGAAILFVLVGRALAVYPLAAIFRRSHLAVPTRYQHILVWGGLRGALGLALALALPAIPERTAIILTTFIVVAFSLFVQGLTMPMLVKRLGILCERETMTSVAGSTDAP